MGEDGERGGRRICTMSAPRTRRLGSPHAASIHAPAQKGGVACCIGCMSDCEVRPTCAARGTIDRMVGAGPRGPRRCCDCVKEVGLVVIDILQLYRVLTYYRVLLTYTSLCVARLRRAHPSDGVRNLSTLSSFDGVRAGTQATALSCTQPYNYNTFVIWHVVHTVPWNWNVEESTRTSAPSTVLSGHVLILRSASRLPSV